MLKLILINQIKSNKYPILITISFFMIFYYIAFAHHDYWFEYDGIYFLGVGKEILAGNGHNIVSPDAPIGGPVLHATLSLVFGDAFVIGKLISLFSGTGIVFFSYYIIKNIFNPKIALVGQLLFAFNPRLQLQSVEALNELLPVFLIVVSLYVITKKNLKLSDIMISGALLGGAFMVRYQALAVIVAMIIFFLIRNKKIRINLFHGIVIGAFFLIACSPILVYNYTTHGVLLDSDTDFYLIQLAKYQTPEWHDNMEESIKSPNMNGIFLDFDLFLKNYFYNLFYHNPDRLFNFDTLGNISMIPPIPFLGIIPVFGGLIYCLKLKLNKNNIITIITTLTITTFVIFLIGDITIHFFMLIIIPFLALGILNLKNVEKNLLPLLVLPVVYFLIISIIPLYTPHPLFPILITAVVLSTIFFVKVIPKLLSLPLKSTRNRKIVTIVLISSILLINAGFSYKLFQYNLYDGESYGGLTDEFMSFFEEPESRIMSGDEIKKIGDILSKQPDIKNSYVMTRVLTYAYYADSKQIHTDFKSGMKNDTLNQFVTRENWSPYDVYYSNISSYPVDKNNLNNAAADYIIYDQIPEYDPNSTWYADPPTYPDLDILLDPTHPDIPSNFEFLYKSDKWGTVVYKIHR